MVATNAAAGYFQSRKNAGTPRTLEYQLFQRVTAGLTTAAEDGTPFTKLAEALHKNNKMWTALACDLAKEENQLPSELRAQLISLAEFSRKHGMLAMSGKADVETLIDINTAVMRGLRGESQSEQSST